MTFKTNGQIKDRKMLAQHIKDFLTYERPRRQLLLDYYNGDQQVDKGRVAPGRPNNKLVSNYARYISDVHTGYFIGIAPTVEFEGKRVQERMNRAISRALLPVRLYAAARDMSVCGVGYLLCYMEESGVRFARLDPRETFLLTEGVEGRIVGAVRICPTGEREASGELYIAGAKCTLHFDGREVHISPEQPLVLKGMPIIAFENNIESRGDFESVLGLLDAYNLLLSGSMDDMQSVANAFLALYGMLGTTKEDVERANQTRVLSLSESGKAEFVVKNLSADSIELMSKILVRDMLSITMTPNLNDEAFSGNSSGVAIEYKLWGAEQARSAKEQGFRESMHGAIKLLAEGQNLLGRVGESECTVRFYRNLPQDLTRISENIERLKGLVSKHTLLSTLPIVADPTAELLKLEEESA